MASRKRGNFPLRLANFFGLIRQPLLFIKEMYESNLFKIMFDHLV